jgi:hypothetical protein
MPPILLHSFIFPLYPSQAPQLDQSIAEFPEGCWPCIEQHARGVHTDSEPRTKELIIAGSDTLTQLGLAAAIKNNVLVIVGRGCGLSVSKRRFHPVWFPGLDGVGARLVMFG